MTGRDEKINPHGATHRSVMALDRCRLLSTLGFFPWFVAGLMSPGSVLP